jgi:hypothetical protein
VSKALAYGNSGQDGVQLLAMPVFAGAIHNPNGACLYA